MRSLFLFQKEKEVQKVNKFDMVNDLLAETSKAVVQDEKSWLSFLDTSSYVFKYDFADQLLIYAQKPDAKACATFDYWNNRMKRWIKKGAKGIALIDDSKKYSSPTQSLSHIPLKGL